MFYKRHFCLEHIWRRIGCLRHSALSVYSSSSGSSSCFNLSRLRGHHGPHIQAHTESTIRPRIKNTTSLSAQNEFQVDVRVQVYHCCSKIAPIIRPGPTWKKFGVPRLSPCKTASNRTGRLVADGAVQCKQATKEEIGVPFTR